MPIKFLSFQLFLLMWSLQAETNNQLNQNKWPTDLQGCFRLSHSDCSIPSVDKMMKEFEVRSALSQFWVSAESLTKIQFLPQISNTHGAKYKAFNPLSSEKAPFQDDLLEKCIFPYHKWTLKRPTVCLRFHLSVI